MSRRTLKDEQWDASQAIFLAEALLSGLRGVGHVIADAAHDAGRLRAFIADNLRVTAQISVHHARLAIDAFRRFGNGQHRD